MVRITRMFLSHRVRPFGRGRTRSLGDEIDHLWFLTVHLLSGMIFQGTLFPTKDFKDSSPPLLFLSFVPTTFGKLLAGVCFFFAGCQPWMFHKKNQNPRFRDSEKRTKLKGWKINKSIYTSTFKSGCQSNPKGW